METKWPLPRQTTQSILSYAENRAARLVCRAFRDAFDSYDQRLTIFPGAVLSSSLADFRSRRCAPLPSELQIVPATTSHELYDLSHGEIASGFIYYIDDGKQEIALPGGDRLVITCGPNILESGARVVTFELLDPTPRRLGKRKISFPRTDNRSPIQFRAFRHVLPGNWLLTLVEGQNRSKVQFHFLDSMGHLSRTKWVDLPDVSDGDGELQDLVFADGPNARQPEIQFSIHCYGDTPDRRLAIPLSTSEDVESDETASRHRALIALAAVTALLAGRYLFTRFSASSR
jgi:hypothetical protein